LIAYGSRAAWHPNSRPLGAFNESGADNVRVVGSAARGEDTDSRDIDLDLLNVDSRP
jgi:predicted nucleotidyltransferase